MAEQLDRIIGVILVGGKSSRMGRDKASLMLNDSRLVDHVAKIITLSGINNVITSGKIKGYEGLPDLVPNKGPVGGICSSLIYCYENLFTSAIIIPVDMPRISVDLMKVLLTHSSNAAVAYFENNPLPFTIKVDQLTASYCAKTNINLSDGGELSVKSFLKNFAVSEIKVPKNLIKDLTNTNTPKEWNEAQI